MTLFIGSTSGRKEELWIISGIQWTYRVGSSILILLKRLFWKNTQVSNVSTALGRLFGQERLLGHVPFHAFLMSFDEPCNLFLLSLPVRPALFELGQAL